MESLFRPPAIGEVLEGLRKRRVPWDEKTLSKHLPFLNGGIRSEILNVAKSVQNYRRSLGDRFVAAVIFGRTVRFREGHRQPSDLDVLFLLKPGAKLPPEPRRLFLEAFAYPEHGPAFEDRVKQPTREGAFMRRLFLLPHVVLHGEDAVRHYRELAVRHYRDSDFNELWSHRKDKVRRELKADPVAANAELMAEHALIEEIKANVGKQRARGRS